jgi:hypothetical protein
MSGLRENFLDSICQEAIKEMAENFFCPRRDLDQEIELFSIRAGAVREKAKTALGRAARLHALLLEGEAAPDFYRAIGMSPGQLIALASVSPVFVRDIPHTISLSRRGFAKITLTAYEATRDAVDEYLNGRLYPDPERPGRKVHSMHYSRLLAWCEEINERIDEVNKRQGASCVLCYFKNLDPAGVERERVTGGGVDNFAQAVDESLRLPHCEFAAYQLPELPELPATESIEDAGASFAKRLFDDHRDRLENILGRMAGFEND